MRLTLPAPQACAECGSEAVYHRVEYIASLMDTVGLPTSSLISRVVGGLGSGGSLGWLYRVWALVGLGEFLDEPDDKTLLLDHMLWQEATRRSIVMREFRFLGLPKSTFVARLANGREVDFSGVPLPKNRTVWWLDEKPVLKKKLSRQGMPTARGGSVWTLAGARQLFAHLEPPVILKPAAGSASRHTVMHVRTEEELKHAFGVVKKLSPKVIVEEELVGAVYRPTLVGGRLIATLRRDQPHVVGDGTRTVGELIEEANKHPGRKGPYFSPINITPDSLAELAYQGFAPESIPEKGRHVTLHPKINWSVGGTTADVTDEVHPDNKALFEDVAALLRAPLVGIDFIINDIGRSWKDQTRCGIIECNSMPFFDNHHLPFEGTPRDVAGPIWDLYLKASSS